TSSPAARGGRGRRKVATIFPGSPSLAWPLRLLAPGRFWENNGTPPLHPSRRAVPSLRPALGVRTMSETTTVPTPSANGHEANGRFAKGNPGGPGNPHARKMAALRKAFLDAVTDEDMMEVTRAVLAKAKGGDLAA